MQAYARREMLKRVFACVNPLFGGLVLYLCGLNIPYFASAFRFIPVHDAMNYATAFFPIYNEYMLHGEIPFWMPFDAYGSALGPNFLFLMSPPMFFMVVVGKLFGMTNALLVFKLAIFIEQLALLVGVYLLSRRLFTHVVTIFWVCIGTVATAFWAVQLQWNFRMYYLMPFVLFAIIKCFETANVLYVPLIGFLLLLSFLGIVTYMVPLLLFVYGVFSVTLLLAKHKDVRFSRDTIVKPATIGFSLVVVILAGLFVGYAGHLTDALTLYAPERKALTGKVALETFLTYAQNFAPHKLLELLYAVPTNHNTTFYVGLLPLLFVLYVLVKPDANRHILHALLMTVMLVVALSLSSYTLVAPLAYIGLPLFDYFRHIGYAYVPAKLLLLLASGFGVDAYLASSGQKWPHRRILVGIGICLASGVLALDVFALKGGLPYFPDNYLQNPALVQFHYLSLAVFIALLIVVSRSGTSSPKRFQTVLILCFLIEITSYHFWVWYMSPVKLAHVEPERFETAEAYAQRSALFQTAFTVRPYAFQSERWPAERVERLIDQTLPLFTRYWGGKYRGTIYPAAYAEPCFQTARVDYLPTSVDRLVRARIGIPLDKPLVAGVPVSQILAEDTVLRRAFGCESPKIFLTAQARIANNLTEAAEMIHTFQDIDHVPVLFKATGGMITLPQSPESPLTSAGNVSVTGFTMNTLNVQADVSASSGAWLIYLDAYHPDWSVTVNGRPRELATANLAFKAVHLDAGPNEVRFRFRGTFWTRYAVPVFCGISLLSTALLLELALWLLIPGLRRNIKS